MLRCRYLGSTPTWQENYKVSQQPTITKNIIENVTDLHWYSFIFPFLQQKVKYCSNELFSQLPDWSCVTRIALPVSQE